MVSTRRAAQASGGLWLPLILHVTIAFAAEAPLFLWMRERRLSRAQINEGSTREMGELGPIPSCVERSSQSSRFGLPGEAKLIEDFLRGVIA